MDKHSKFNKWLLTVVGVLLVGYFLITSTVFFPFSGCSNRGRVGGMAVPEAAKKSQADSLHKQVVSFTQIILLDTAKEAFLVAVGQTEAGREGQVLGSSGSFRYYGGSGDNLNNLLLCTGSTGEARPLFNKRFNISRFQLFGRGPSKSVVAFFADSDTNGDNLLNNDDLEKLAVWMPGWAEPKEIATPNTTPLEVKISERNFLVVAAGEDRNRDGHFDRNREPVRLYRLGFGCGEPQCVDFQPIVDNQAIARLQKTLDGN